MKSYIQTKIVTAEPECHADGRAGFRVVDPEGFASWIDTVTFMSSSRAISFHERQLIEQTDAEHQISAISDGDPEHCEHEPGYDKSVDETYCEKCLERLPNDPRAPALSRNRVMNVCRDFSKGRYSEAWGDFLCARCGNLRSSHK